MSKHPLIRATLLAAALATTAVLAQTPYDEGQKALREQRWMEASRHFQEAKGGQQAAAAMYWRAHALYKAGHRGEAARELDELERRFPESSWVGEAEALRIEQGGSIDDAIVEDELRLFALSSLMHRDLERALPMVLELMKNTRSESVRRDAMFLLGVSDSPEATQAIADIARSTEDPGLQAEALHMLGGAATESSLALLHELYFDSDSERARGAIIQAYTMAGDPEPLAEFLAVEKSPQLQREIIHALGMTGATDKLETLYATLDSRESRVAALEAMSMAGDSTLLRTVLESETDPELRRTAIQGVAMQGGKDATGFLESAYRNTASREEKVVLLESLAMLGGGKEIALQVIRDETDPRLQRRAIELLGMLGATEDLNGLYVSLADRDVRRTVLESMMIANDRDGILHVLRTETEPELRVAAIHGLAVVGLGDATEFLAELYGQASLVERRAIMESMMMMNDVQGLIALLEQEQDMSLKREMLQLLSAMDSEEATEYLFKLLEERG